MITAMGWQVFWKRDTSGLHHGRTMGWLGADGRSEVGNTDEYVIMQVISSHFNLKYSFSSAL
jgi:hypothetical protein